MVLLVPPVARFVVEHAGGRAYNQTQAILSCLRVLSRRHRAVLDGVARHSSVMDAIVVRSASPAAFASAAFKKLRFYQSLQIPVKRARIIVKLLTSRAVARLCRFPNLQHVDFVGCGDGLTKAASEILAKANLQIVNFKADEYTTDATVKRMSKCPHLRTAIFDFCHMVTDNAAKSLSKCPNLHTVAFDYCDTTDRAAKYLARCPQLQSVSLSENISDKATEHLAKCPQLKSLRFRGAEDLSDIAGQNLGKCLQLQTLIVEDCFALGDLLTDAFIMHVVKCPQLRHLSYDFFTDASLAHLVT